MAIKKQYDSIQLMRGIAALTVVFMHIQMVQNGAFGVELFFCISGFIMMHVTEHGHERFLAKRILRIVPLYWVVTLLTSAILIAAPTVFRTLVFEPQYLIKTLCFIPYYYTGDSGDTVNALVQVGWTLIVEVFYYLLFYVSLRISEKYRHYICSAVLVLMVIVGALYHGDSTFIRFYCEPVILEFVLGMFAYRILTKTGAKSLSTPSRVVCVIAAVLLWGFLFAEKHIAFFDGIDRMVKYGLPAFAVFVLLFKGLDGCRIPKPLILLGNVSYSLYLTHSFVVQGFSRLVYNIDTYSPLGVLLVVVAVLPLTVATAYASWWLIEKNLTAWLYKTLLKKR